MTKPLYVKVSFSMRAKDSPKVKDSHGDHYSLDAAIHRVLGNMGIKNYKYVYGKIGKSTPTFELHESNNLARGEFLKDWTTPKPIRVKSEWKRAER